MTESNVDVTVVVPIYRSANSINKLVDRLAALANQLAPKRLEVIFVDDGSPDNSVARLKSRLPTLFDAVVLRHTRNFGAFAATRSGLAAASGAIIGVMAADLQEPPELIPRAIEELERTETSVAYGKRTRRYGDPLTSRVASALFWRIYRRFVQPQMPAGGIDIFVCRRAVIDELLSLEESHTSLVGSLIWLGFPSCEVSYERASRADGERSAWTLAKRLRYMADSAFSLSRLPLSLLGFTGGLGLIGCFLVGVGVILARLTGGITVPGYTAIMLTVVACTCLLLVALWIVGDIAWRAYENTKSRPNAVLWDRSSHARIGVSNTSKIETWSNS